MPSVPTLVLAGVVALLYGLSAALLGRRLAGHRTSPAWTLGAAPALLALPLQILFYLLAWQGVPELHFFSALSLVGLGMAALTTPVVLDGRMPALGLVAYPLAAASLLVYALFGAGKPATLDWQMHLHAWSALLAYAALSVAAVLAIGLWVQERALRQRRLGGWLHALPPLTQLESLLFRTLAASFVLLSMTLLSGVLFVSDLLAQHLAHKTVLSVLSWLVLAVLLFGRWRWGWRGPRAVKLTLTAMALLALAFFGSKFVLELVLGRV
jgi:ABC-type uncharacterized transport system permease subunit